MASLVLLGGLGLVPGEVHDPFTAFCSKTDEFRLGQSWVLCPKALHEKHRVEHESPNHGALQTLVFGFDCFPEKPGGSIVPFPATAGPTPEAGSNLHDALSFPPAFNASCASPVPATPEPCPER